LEFKIKRPPEGFYRRSLMLQLCKISRLS